jgi:hypothetical protein
MSILRIWYWSVQISCRDSTFKTYWDYYLTRKGHSNFLGTMSTRRASRLERNQERSHFNQRLNLFVPNQDFPGFSETKLIPDTALKIITHFFIWFPQENTDSAHFLNPLFPRKLNKASIILSFYESIAAEMRSALVSSKVSWRTKALFVVHQNGVSCIFSQLLFLAVNCFNNLSKQSNTRNQCRLRKTTARRISISKW